MIPLIHCLSQKARSRNWLVRIDGEADVILPTREHALDHARTVAARLATRLGQPVQVRVWKPRARFDEETIQPCVPPLERVNRRRERVEA